MCVECSNALESQNRSAHEFLKLKDRGGLKRLSQGAISICMEAERVFQRMLKVSGGKLPQGFGVVDAIVTAVLENTQHIDIYPELHNHQFDTADEDNHVHILIKRICSYYTRIRLYHLGKEFTAIST